MFRNLVNETQAIAETVHRDCAGTIQIACETCREEVDALFIVRKLLFDFKVTYRNLRGNTSSNHIHPAQDARLEG